MEWNRMGKKRKGKRILILGLDPPKPKWHPKLKARLLQRLGFFNPKPLYFSSTLTPFRPNFLNNYDNSSLSFAL